jgi:hypothetical protein
MISPDRLAVHRQMIEFHRTAADADHRRAEQLTESIAEADHAGHSGQATS